MLHSAISCISFLSNMMPYTAKGKFNFEGYKSIQKYTSLSCLRRMSLMEEHAEVFLVQYIEGL